VMTRPWVDYSIRRHADPSNSHVSLRSFGHPFRPPNITTPFNIGGQPAMNLPCGFSREGLPISLQLAARHFDEALMLRVGHCYQTLTDWHTRRPTEGLVQ